MSEKEAVTVEAAAEEKVTESKEAKGTKRAAEVRLFLSIRIRQATSGWTHFPLAICPCHGSTAPNSRPQLALHPPLKRQIK